jgi:hypothetical protein
VRLRPIVMTSFAFILGVLPLVIAQGAGAEMRRTLGTAVFAGMIGVTLFGIFLTPVFFYVIRRIAERQPSTGEQDELLEFTRDALRNHGRDPRRGLSRSADGHALRGSQARR